MKYITSIQLTLMILPSLVPAMLQCYNVQGTAMDESFQPCDTTADVSSCCQLNQANPEVCLGNGLCLATNNNYAGTIWGEGCTDSSGNDTKCPQICHGKVKNSDFWSIMQCPKQRTWCCRAFGDWTSCCDNEAQLVTLSMEDVTPMQVSNTGSNTTNALPENDKGSNAGLIGGVVGGALGFAFIASLVAAILLWKQNRRLKKDTKGFDVTEVPANSTNQYSDVPSAQQYKTSQYPWTSPVEADGVSTRYTSELEGNRQS